MVGGAGAYSEWEGGSNHVLLIPDSTTTSSLAVRVEWGAGTAVLDDTGRKKVSAPRSQRCRQLVRQLPAATAAGSTQAAGAKGSSGLELPAITRCLRWC